MKTLNSIYYWPAQGTVYLNHADESGFCDTHLLDVVALPEELQSQAAAALGALANATETGELPHQVILEKGPLTQAETPEGEEPLPPVQEFMSIITGEASSGSRTRSVQCIPEARDAIAVIWAALEASLNQ